MMADYRGGERRESRYGDELVKAIREGRTESQRKRNFNQKLIFAAANGALAMGSGMAKSMRSHNDAMAHQAIDAEREAAMPTPNYRPMASGPGDAKMPEWLTTGNPKAGDRTELGVDNSVTSALRPDTPVNPYDRDPMMARAEAALNQDDEEKPKVTWGSGRGMMGSQ